MYITLVVIIILLVLALLFLNIYFRVKVFKSYKKLVQSKVEFDMSHVTSRKKLEEEILPKYPAQRQEILDFIRHLRFSFRIGMIIFVFICLFGWVLMRYRS